MIANMGKVKLVACVRQRSGNHAICPRYFTQRICDGRRYSIKPRIVKYSN